ncbi:MAG TPA: type II secretion system protein GspN, partial [Byssovorax sp.]
SAGADEKEKKESVVTIDEAHARLKILPLVIGRLKVGFWLSALGGEIKGVMPILGSSGDIQVELENVDIGRVEPFVHAIGGVPIHGIASGKVDLSPENGKLSKGSGTVELTIADVVVSDGKTKIQGLIELPAARMGDLTLSGEAKDGILVVNKLEAKGTDIELLGAGKVGLHDNWQNSVAELFVRFKFSDSYRGKNDLTKGLFGAPGGGGGGLIEMQVPKMKRAKRPDGFYGFHAHGPLKKLSFDPTQADGPGVPGPAASGIAGPGAKRPAANNPFMHKGKVPQPNGGPGGQNRFNPVAPGTPAPSAAPAAEAPAAAPEAPAAEAPAAAPAPEPPAPEPQPEQPAEAPAE